MKDIIVSITDGKRTYSEIVTEDVQEFFEDDAQIAWTRELPEFEFTITNIERYNTNNTSIHHFIFGWVECFNQFSDVAGWMLEDDVYLKISVKHVEVN